MGRHFSTNEPVPEPRPVRAFLLTMLLQVLGIMTICLCILGILLYAIFI